MRSTSRSSFLHRRFLSAIAAAAMTLGMIGFVAAPSTAATNESLTASSVGKAGPKAPGSTNQARHTVTSVVSPTQGPRRLHTSFDETRNAVSETATSVPVPPAGSFSIASTGSVGTAQISGRVTSAVNVGVAGSMVYASNDSGEYWAFTDSLGNYTLTNLPAGSYTITFDSTVSKSVKNVTAGQRKTAVDARVALKAQIKGKVSAPGGAGIPDIAVRVFKAADENNTSAWTFTDANGNYFVHGLAAGSYKVHYEADYVTSGSFLPVWNADKANFFAADALSLASTQVATGVNESLLNAGTISGTVTTQAQAPIAGISVLAYDISAQWLPVSAAITNSQGEYTLRHLPLGKYRIEFKTSSQTIGNFAPTWYLPGSTTDLSALGQAITVSSTAAITDVNQSLVQAGSISGKVSGKNGVGLAGVYVSVMPGNLAYQSLAGTSTDTQGNYVLRGLPAGSYRIQYDATSVTSGSYPLTWSGGKPTFDTAESIGLAYLAAVTYNIQLDSAAQILGKITNSSGVGLGGVQITATGPNYEWDGRGYATTAANGTYVIRGLPAGVYKIRVDASYGVLGSNQNGWYGPATTYDKAAKITLSARQSKTGVNLKLVKAAQISGMVTDQSGQGIPRVAVNVYNATTGESLQLQSSTDALGKYTIVGVPAGNYKLLFTPQASAFGSYLPRWSGNQNTQDAASSISVATGANKTGNNARLLPAATLTSTIVTADGAVAGATVNVYSSIDDSYPVAYGSTDSSGNVVIRGLAAGSYKLRLDASQVTDINVVSGWIFGTTFADATAVTFTDGEVKNVAITPAVGGTISGTVLDEAGLPLSGVRVEAHVPAALEPPAASSVSDSNGHYVITGLSTQLYVLYFAAGDVTRGHYLSQWLGDTGNSGVVGGLAENAATWSITPGFPLTAPSRQLTPSGGISGNLTTDEGDPLEGIRVSVVSATDQNNEINSTTSNAEGNYQVYGLPAGSFKVRYDTSPIVGKNLRETWNKEKPTFETADVITLTLSQLLTGKDSEILSGAQLMGKVTAKTGGKPVAGVSVSVCPLTAGPCFSAPTDSTGAYLVSGIPAGRYKVIFGSNQTVGSYLPAFSGNKLTYDDATVVTFASHQVRTMSYQLISAATITGRVIDSHGAGIQDVEVMTFSKTTNQWIGGYVFTDAQGYYTLKGVDSTGVKIMFEAGQAQGGPFVSEWNNDKATWDLAATMTVGVGRTLANVNATLADLVWTSFTGSTGYSGVTIDVYDMDQQLVKSVVTGSGGDFVITNVPDGDYKIHYGATAQMSGCTGGEGWYTTGLLFFNSSFGGGSTISLGNRQAVALRTASWACS